MGLGMMGVMHIYFHFTQPLFIQALMGVKNLYDAKPIALYILGKPATGDLKRPFKAASMFGRESLSIFLSDAPFFFSIIHPLIFNVPHATLLVPAANFSPTASAGPATDAAAIAEAEKRIVKKEE